MTIVDPVRSRVESTPTSMSTSLPPMDGNGGMLGVESFPTTTDGFAQLHVWLCGFGSLERVGVEGTGAYGAGLARFLRTAGEVVIEVDRPNRQVRRRHGKSDSIDAVEAARARSAAAPTDLSVR